MLDPSAERMAHGWRLEIRTVRPAGQALRGGGNCAVYDDAVELQLTFRLMRSTVPDKLATSAKRPGSEQPRHRTRSEKRGRETEPTCATRRMLYTPVTDTWNEPAVRS